MKSDLLKKVSFEYKNRIVKKVMIPVVIAQNNNLHEFFTIFISGVTGIPTGLAIHKLPDMKNIPLIRVVVVASNNEPEDKYLIPLLKYAYQKFVDSIIRVPLLLAFHHSFIIFANKRSICK